MSASRSHSHFFLASAFSFSPQSIVFCSHAVLLLHAFHPLSSLLLSFRRHIFILVYAFFIAFFFNTCMYFNHSAFSTLSLRCDPSSVCAPCFTVHGYKGGHEGYPDPRALASLLSLEIRPLLRLNPILTFSILVPSLGLESTSFFA